MKGEAEDEREKGEKEELDRLGNEQLINCEVPFYLFVVHKKM